MEFLIVLSKNLKILRIKKDVSQEFLSKKIGVSIQTINKWENDKCLPDAYNLLKLADYYSLSVEELINKKFELV